MRAGFSSVFPLFAAQRSKILTHEDMLSQFNIFEILYVCKKLVSFIVWHKPSDNCTYVVSSTPRATWGHSGAVPP